MKLLQIYIAIGSTILAGVIAFVWYKCMMRKYEKERKEQLDKILKEKELDNKEVTDVVGEKKGDSNSKEGSEDTTEHTSATSKMTEVDPFEYVGHLQGEVKKIHQKVAAKKIMDKLTPEQIEEERETERRQLKEIFELMQSTSCGEGGAYGVASFDEMQQQMKLYA